jgi:hypothetical protein
MTKRFALLFWRTALPGHISEHANRTRNQTSTHIFGLISRKNVYRDCRETPELYAFVEKQLYREDLGPRVQILANALDLCACVCVLGHCGWNRLRLT